MPFDTIINILITFVLAQAEQFNLTYYEMQRVAETAKNVHKVAAIKELRLMAAYPQEVLNAIDLLRNNDFTINFPTNPCGLKEAKEFTEAIIMIWATNNQHRLTCDYHAAEGT